MPNDLICEICSSPNVGDHHILHRSLGGDDSPHNLARICAQCHFQLHPEKMGGTGWEIQRSGEYLRVVDKVTREIIVDRQYDPLFDEGRFIQRLDLLPGYLQEFTSEVKYLSDEALIQAVEIVYRDVGKQAWVFVAEAIRVAALRMPWGKRGEKIEAIAREAGIKYRQAYNWAKALEAFLPERIYNSPLQEVGWFVVAAGKAEPEAALTKAEDTKDSNPRFTIKAFESDIYPTDPPERVWCTCTRCGARHLRKE